ncbi:MAG: hypothetical protein QF890_01150 [Myxococcota bacterium]|jgi:hypothetical protein|nr:hypothetical protein [Deltaproteobacteria bacterium]MCP4244302.1 hypothetical protein [bacterium]MDP6074912.1 hypothetical protein [Myxococcota bacterium]MBT40148.1 hypothetical protein [Deltaproteobacteria bacterium]MDP6241879.1 hypothetical protein [Myxococcota bacterium]
MALVRLAIDYEFSSRQWWDQGGQDLWEALADASETAAIVLDEALADSWLAQAGSLPGWNDGPEYAPHPIAVSPADEEDEALV